MTTSPLVPLGSTGLMVSRLCFGTLQLRLIEVSPATAAELFARALDLNVNFFDTAQLYGTQPHLGEALKQQPRERMIISTRANRKTREEMQAAFEESLRVLGTDYIDVYGMHGVVDWADWELKQPAWEYILERKAAGQIRATIVTSHSAHLVGQMAGVPEVDAVMGIHNMTGFGLIDETLENAERAAKALHAAGKAFLAMKPLAAGGHVRRVDEALNFYVDRPHVTCIAIGMQSLAEVEMNIHLIHGLDVPPEVRRRAEGQERRLLIREWCKGCGLCIEVCPQRAMTLVEVGQSEDGKPIRRPQVDAARCLSCGYCSLRCPTTAAKIISYSSVLS